MGNIMKNNYLMRLCTFGSICLFLSGCFNTYNVGILANPNLPQYANTIVANVSKCWAAPPSSKKYSARIDIELNQDTSLKRVYVANVDAEQYKNDPEFRKFADSAMRAVEKCSPMPFLPKDRFDVWHIIEANFDGSSVF